MFSLALNQKSGSNLQKRHKTPLGHFNKNGSRNLLGASGSNFSFKKDNKDI